MDNQPTQPTNTPAISLPPQAQQPIGKSGTYFFKGYITAEEYSIDLQGKYALQVYDVMRKSDATVHAALSIIKQPILGADWDFDPASKDEVDIEVCDRMKRELMGRKIIFHDLLREVLTFLDFGHFVAEEVFENTEDENGPYIGFAKIASRKQRSILKWSQDDDTPGITQILPSGGSVNIPRQKLLYVVNEQEGENYLGVSLLRYIYKPWKIKDSLEIMNAISLEKMGLGIPYIKKNVNGLTTDETELEDARDMLRQQRANEEAYFEYPDSIEIGFTDMKGSTTKEIIPTIEYQDHQILLSVLAQFLLLGSNDSAGSKAVSADHSSMFVKSIQAVVQIVKDAITRDVVQRWVDLNYSNLENGYPQLKCTGIDDEDMISVSTAIAAVFTAGAMQPSAEVENLLRKLFDIPEMTDEEVEAYDEKVAANKPAPPVFGQPGVPVDPANPVVTPTPKQGLPDTNGDPKLDDAEGALEAKKAAKTKAAIDNARAAQKQLLGAFAGF